MYSIRYYYHILIKIEFPRHFMGKNSQIPNFMKIGRMEAELFHPDR
jgi:hypothetical protein